MPQTVTTEAAIVSANRAPLLGMFLKSQGAKEQAALLMEIKNELEDMSEKEKAQLLLWLQEEYTSK